MPDTLALLPAAAPAAFAGVAALGTLRVRRPVRLLERSAAVAAVLGLGAALVGGIAVAAGGSRTSGTLGVDGVGLSIRLDPLSVVMLGMIAVLAAVVFRFSATYLDGDERHHVFLRRLAATIAAVELLVIAGNLGLFVAAWIATSLALHRLLVFYPARPRAVLAARKKFVIARIGDVFLVAAAVLLVAHFGTGDIATILEDAEAAAPGWALGATGVAALCLAITAMLKSAQLPTHGWLVEVMETPTPVSALLHAGILNAGPFLAIRFAAALELSRTATSALIVVGSITAIFASVVLLTQPAIKAALAYSSAAHMGFMLMVCGMGLYPAALLHLVAHSCYKAHAFLASGSAIDEARAAHVPLPRRLGSPVRLVASAAIALALYLPLAFAFGVSFESEPVLLAVGAILVLGTTQLVAPALDSTGPAIAVARATMLALAVTLSFFTLESGAHALLVNTLPESVPRDGLQLALVGAVLVAFTTVVGFQLVEPARAPSPWRRRLAIHLRNGLYANAALDRLVGGLRIPRPQPAR